MKDDYLQETIDAMKAADDALSAAESTERFKDFYMEIYEVDVKNANLYVLLSIAVELRRIADVLTGASEYGGANDALRINVLR